MRRANAVNEEDSERDRAALLWHSFPFYPF